MQDREFIDSVAQALKVGLEEFFPSSCKVNVAEPGDEPEHFDFDSQFVCVSVTFDEQVLCQLELMDEAVRIAPGHFSEYDQTPHEVHEYCHPLFPNTVLLGLERLLKRKEKLQAIVVEATEIADENPPAALEYFLAECQKSPLLSCWIVTIFSDVLKMQVSDARHRREAVVEWLNSLELPEITEQCG
jgi:hypothetical protein